MGVLSCNRVGCGNIMCYRSSPKYGYICDYCFEELCSLGADANIEDFMGIRKEHSHSKEDPYEKFDSIFELNP